MLLSRDAASGQARVTIRLPDGWVQTYSTAPLVDSAAGHDRRIVLELVRDSDARARPGTAWASLPGSFAEWAVKASHSASGIVGWQRYLPLGTGGLIALSFGLLAAGPLSRLFPGRVGGADDHAGTLNAG